MSRLPLVGFFVLLCAAGWFYFRSVEPANPPPTPATCLQLADSPALYAGKVVRVSTAGCVPARGELHWRRFDGELPSVVLRARTPIPVPPPSHLVGTCHAPLAGGPVVVSDCRP